MMQSRIPLLVPDMPTADDLLPYLRRIDAARWYSNFGPLCRELEDALRSRFQVRNDAAVQLTSVSNCTLGLELALQALDLAPGGRVLVPALTFVATATAIARAGLVPVICDVDPDNWMLTPRIAAEALAACDAAAAMPVATFGCPQDGAAWDAFTRETGCPVVIDAAAAFGNQWHVGRTPAVFSLHATKSFASGEGGIVVSRDAYFVERIRQLSNFGINLDRDAPIPVGSVDRPGTNAKLSEYHAAIGLANLGRWDSLSRARIRLFRRYREALEGLPALAPRWQRAPDDMTRTLMCFRTGDAGLREAIELACADRQIDTRRWYLPPLHRHPGFVNLPRMKNLEVAEAIADDLIGLPFHSQLDDAAIGRICAAVRCAAGPGA